MVVLVRIAGDICPPNTYDTDAYIIKIMPDGDYIVRRFDKADTLCLFSTVKILDNGNYFVIGIKGPADLNNTEIQHKIVINIFDKPKINQLLGIK